MSALAHPVPVVPLPVRPVRRRHLTLVPPTAAPEPREAAAVVPPAAPASRAAAPTDAPMRLTVRGRRVLAALVILAAAALGSVGGAMLGSTDQASGAATTVTVSSGDTLWSIAAGVTAPGDDVRDVMVQIAEMNDLQGGVLLAGQQLEIPAAD